MWFANAKSIHEFHDIFCCWNYLSQLFAQIHSNYLQLKPIPHILIDKIFLLMTSSFLICHPGVVYRPGVVFLTLAEVEKWHHQSTFFKETYLRNIQEDTISRSQDTQFLDLNWIGR